MSEANPRTTHGGGSLTSLSFVQSTKSDVISCRLSDCLLRGTTIERQIHSVWVI